MQVNPTCSNPQWLCGLSGGLARNGCGSRVFDQFNEWIDAGLTVHDPFNKWVGLRVHGLTPLTRLDPFTISKFITS